MSIGSGERSCGPYLHYQLKHFDMKLQHTFCFDREISQIIISTHQMSENLFISLSKIFDSNSKEIATSHL